MMPGFIKISETTLPPPGRTPAHNQRKLEKSRNIAMFGNMNAAQIIEEIERLPEDERGKVLDFARHHPNVDTLQAMREPTDDLPRFETVEDLFKELQD